MSVKLGKKLVSRPNKDIFLSQNGKVLVKVFNHKIVPESDALSEAAIYAMVQESTKLNIPELLEVYKHGSDWCLAFNYIEGETLEEKMKKEPENEHKYLEDMLDLQLRVHACKVDKLPPLVDKLQKRIHDSNDIIPATTRFELHTRLDAVPKHYKLIHGDFVPSNIIYAPDGKVYILDWAHATKGNGSADCCFTYLNFYLDGREDLAKEYLDLFCQKTDTAIQYVQRWMPICAAFLAKKNSGEKREKLLTMADVVEYM